MERRSPAIIKIHAYQRYVIWHYLQHLFNNVRVCEFPKSGGTWVSQMLGAALNLDFPRNKSLPLRSIILHSHYPGPTKSPTIVVVRDGRDVMTSAYFHFLIYSESRPKHLIQKWRTIMGTCDFENVMATMPQFIEKFSTQFKIGGVHMNWSQHIRSFNTNNEKILWVKYENVLSDTKNELSRILTWLDRSPEKSLNAIINDYSFSSQTKRVAGQEDRKEFLRKGISGDWKNYFNSEAIEVFNHYHLEGLKTLGYD